MKHTILIFYFLLVYQYGNNSRQQRFVVTNPPLDPCRYKDISLVTVHQVPIKSIKYIWKKPCLFDKNNDTQSVLTEIL
jgi:hypothetical protein